MKKRILPLLLALALLLSACGAVPQSPAKAEGTLIVHFLDVGQADCALVELDGKYLLIDGGNKEDSQLVVSFLEQQGVEELEGVVCTHAHEDHVGGLPGVLAVYPAKAVYAPTKTYASKVFDDFVYYTDQQGLEITIPEPGDSIPMEGLDIQVLGPVKSYAETNDTSLVLRIAFGETVFLFTGDMETAAEDDMLDYWDSQPQLLEADVLKVGHHGSDTSTGYRFLRQVAPEYGVISVGTDNSYGHPNEAPLSRLNQAEVTVLRTDTLGTITATSDGTEVQFTWEKSTAKPDAPAPSETTAQTYIGNKNSKKFHLPSCPNLPSEENRVELPSYDEAIAQGFEPCGNCLG